MKTVRHLFLILILSCAALPLQSQQLMGTAGSQGISAGIHLSWSLGEPLTQTLQGSSNVITQGFQQPWERYRLFGTLTYANAYGTPLPDFSLEAMPPGSSTAAITRTDPQSRFFWYGLDPGSYVFNGNSSVPPGSINATDALLVMRHFTHYVQLNGIHLKAADVNASGAVNATDALDICRFFVDSITSFPAGTWLVSPDTLQLGVNTQQHNLEALCYGDVNASFIPPGIPKQAVQLREEGQMLLPERKEILIPVQADEAMEIGAYSLALYESSDLLDIKEVASSLPEGKLLWKKEGNSLRLTWMGMKAHRVEKGDPLFLIRAGLENGNDWLDKDIAFIASDGSELCDGEASPYEAVALSIPAIKVDLLPDHFLAGDIYPNPASDLLHIRLALPCNSRIALRITDLRGSLLYATTTDRLDEGSHEMEVKVDHLATGSYLLQLEMLDQCQSRLVRKFVLMQNR